MKLLLIWFIHIYQSISRLVPFRLPACKFYPSCSNYALSALRKYTLPAAIFKIAARLLRCHPFSNGGFDPIK